jgi:protein TonB
LRLRSRASDRVEISAQSGQPACALQKSFSDLLADATDSFSTDSFHSGRRAMFEDSTFESEGRIRTRSRGWMVAALMLDAAIVLALILIPLAHPEALPDQAIAFLMQVPPPPITPLPAVLRQTIRTTATTNEMMQAEIQAPRQIPQTIANLTGPVPGDVRDVVSMDSPGVGPGGDSDVFRSQPAPRVVHQGVTTPVRISSGVAASIALQRQLPVYPFIGKEAGVQGTVILAAIISKTGTVENLRVVSGPAMLQQAAIDAVKTWRYRPYLLNGQPVDVETTVNVVFTLQR